MNSDITTANVPLTVRNLVLGGVFLFLTGGGGTAAWIDLKSENKANRDEIKLMQCDIRELKNFMLYGEKPKSQKECK